MLKYTPRLVSTAEQINAVWPHVLPYISYGVARAGFDTETDAYDFYDQLVSGQAFLVVVESDGDPGRIHLAIIFNIVQYPKLGALNILAIVGEDLDEIYKQAWPKFAGWASLVGVKAVEGHVSPAMARMLRKYGFKQTAVAVRVMLE